MFEPERVPQVPFDGTYGLDTTSLEYSILSSMLHDSDGTLGDSPDSYIPPIDKLENYTHVSNGAPNAAGSQGALNRPLNSWSVQQQLATPMLDTSQLMPMYQDGTHGIDRSLPTMPSFDTQHGITPSELSHVPTRPTDNLPPEAQQHGTRQEPQQQSMNHDQLKSFNDSDARWRERVMQVYKNDTRPCLLYTSPSPRD